MADKSTVLALILKDGVSGPAKKIKAEVTGITSSFGKLGSVLAGFGMGVGMAAFNLLATGIRSIANAIPDLIQKGLDFADTVDSIGDVTGASAVQTSRFAGTLDYLGIKADSVIARLPMIANAAMKNEKALNAMGVSIREADGTLSNQVTILDRVRQAINGAADSAGGAALAVKLFGRNAGALADYLSLSDDQVAALNDELDRMGVTMTDAGANAAEMASREINLLGLAVQGLANTIAVTVAPALTEAVSAVGRFITANATAIATFVSQVTGFVLGMIEGIFGAVGAAKSFSASMGDLTGQGNEFNDSLRNIYDGLNRMGTGATRAGSAATNASDRQLAAIKRLDERQEKIFQREMRRINGTLDARLNAIDAVEAAEDRAERAAELRERLKAGLAAAGGGGDIARAKQELADFDAALARDAVYNAEESASQRLRLEKALTAAYMSDAEDRAAQIAEAKQDLADFERDLAYRSTNDAEENARRRIELVNAIAEAEVAAAKEVADAQKALVDYQQDIRRDDERAAIAATQQEIDAVQNIESTALSTKEALATLSRKREEAKRRLDLAKQTGDTGAALREQALLDAVDVTERRIRQKQRTSDLTTELEKQRAATATHVAKTTALFKPLFDYLKTEPGKVADEEEKARVVIVDGKKKIIGATSGPKDSIVSAMDAARSAGLKFAQDLKAELEKLEPTIRDIAGAFAEIALFIASALGFLVRLINKLPAIPDWLPKLLTAPLSPTGFPDLAMAVTKELARQFGIKLPGTRGGGAGDFLASGGPVLGGRPYVVGESGAELFVPRTSGTIMPSGSFGGGPVGITVVYSPTYSSASPAEARQFAASILPELTREMRRQGVA